MKRLSVLLIVLFTLGLTSCIIFSEITRYKTISNNIEKLINKYPFIITITEFWGFNGKSGNFNDPVAFDIKMEKGKRLFIAYIRSSDLKSPFIIYLVGKSTFDVHVWVVNRGFWARRGIPSEFLSKNIQVELKSVEDVIENYDLIYNFTNSLTKLADINELLDIDDRYKIVTNWGETYGSVGLGWRKYKYIKPIVYNEDEWFILNITQDEFPDYYNFLSVEKEHKWEERIIHYRK